MAGAALRFAWAGRPLNALGLRLPSSANTPAALIEVIIVGLPLSVLYLSPVPEGGAAVDALRQ